MAEIKNATTLSLTCLLFLSLINATFLQWLQ